MRTTIDKLSSGRFRIRMADSVTGKLHPLVRGQTYATRKEAERDRQALLQLVGDHKAVHFGSWKPPEDAFVRRPRGSGYRGKVPGGGRPIGVAIAHLTLIVPPLGRLAGVYFVRAGDAVKIGWSKDVASRVRSIQVANAQEVELVALVEGGEAEERELHDLFAPHHIRGEWYRHEGLVEATIAKLRRAGGSE